MANRSAIPDANTASVSGSRTENFRDELPQLMTRIGKSADTPEQLPNGKGIVNPEGGWIPLDRARSRRRCVGLRSSQLTLFTSSLESDDSDQWGLGIENEDEHEHDRRKAQRLRRLRGGRTRRHPPTRFCRLLTCVGHAKGGLFGRFDPVRTPTYFIVCFDSLAHL